MNNIISFRNNYFSRQLHLHKAKSEICRIYIILLSSRTALVDIKYFKALVFSDAIAL